MSTHDARSLVMPVTHAAIDDAVIRTVTIAGLMGVAVIHVLQLPDAFSETFYLGLLFVGAVVAAVLVAAALTRTSGRGVWTAAAALPALILLGYLLSRTTGLPDATNDVGEWEEPLGLTSMVAEGLVVCVSAAVLTAHRPPVTAAAAPGAASWAQRCRAAALGFMDRRRDDAPPHLLGDDDFGRDPKRPTPAPAPGPQSTLP
jgi:hypothetical protein